MQMRPSIHLICERHYEVQSRDRKAARTRPCTGDNGRACTVSPVDVPPCASVIRHSVDLIAAAVAAGRAGDGWSRLIYVVLIAATSLVCDVSSAADAGARHGLVHNSTYRAPVSRR